MAKENKAPSGAAGNAGVITLGSQCPVEGCKHKAERSAFCTEHFVWFKEGLVTRQGEKPKDFDRKYQAFLQKHKKVA